LTELLPKVNQPNPEIPEWIWVLCYYKIKPY